MSQEPEPFEPGITIENNAETGAIDFTFVHPTEGSVTLGLPPPHALFLVNVGVARLMQRGDPEIVEGLQTFAIHSIEADKMPDGRLYLKYFMENGLGFATGLPKEDLTTLYHQLGDLLGWPAPRTDGETAH